MTSPAAVPLLLLAGVIEPAVAVPAAEISGQRGGESVEVPATRLPRTVACRPVPVVVVVFTELPPESVPVRA